MLWQSFMMTSVFWGKKMTKLWVSFQKSYHNYAPVKLFWPHPPTRIPGTSLLFCCPSLFLTLFLPCPTLINQLSNQMPCPFSTSFSSATPFLSPTLFFWSRSYPGRMGPEQFDRCIIDTILESNEHVLLAENYLQPKNI